MEKKAIGDWWRDTGSIELNKVLVEIVGEKIGYIPLENLFAEFCNPSIYLKEEELIPLMVTDGATIRVKELKSGERQVLIWIK